MEFFLDPAIVTLPILTEVARDDFLDFVDNMNDWAQLLSSSNHEFYVSRRCKNELYNSERIEYPPDHATLSKYWEALGIVEYSLSDVYTACERLLDVDTLTTIETMAEKEEDPYFETRTVDVSPDAIYIKHHDEMREALKTSLGSLAYFREVKRHEEIFARIMIASYGVLDEVVDVNADIYTLTHDGEEGKIIRHTSTFRILTQPTRIDDYINIRDKIASGLRVMVVGGHQNFFRRLEDLKRAKRLDLRCIGPEDDAKIPSFKKMIDGIDCVIEATTYSSHKLAQIVKDAIGKGVIVEHINSQGLEEFEKALAEASGKIKTAKKS